MFIGGGVGGAGRLSARGRAAPIAGGPVSISGTLPDAIIGQPYDASLTVSPPGSAITLAPELVAALAARGISHDGFGRFTAASVT